ncbi:MAG: MBL fold metallo-hydrolase [Planctomycetales bacterium]|nr:MBL fold metallo-hydrolase [Planctomycetales bacterium]
MIGCDCPVCSSENPRNRRTRCGAILGLPEGNLLIDTPPDLREQLLREKIGIVHSVVYTHEHADHIFGLDDLRLMQFYLGGPVPIYCEDLVEKRIRKSFDYAFRDRSELHAGAVPQIEIRRIDQEPFACLGVQVTPIPLNHGPHFDVFGFRIGDVAYCTDVKEIPHSSKQLLHGLDDLVLGCLRRTPHATHFSLDEALEAVDELAPRRTWFTHCSHEFDYDALNDELPAHVRLAYDGLEIPLK